MKSENKETNEREMTIHDLFCEDIEFLFEPDEKCEAIKVEKVGGFVTYFSPCPNSPEQECHFRTS